MGSFYNMFVTLLDILCFGFLDSQWNGNLSGLIKNILICVLKVNQSLKGLKWHEGEQMMTEVSFLAKVTL